MPRRLPPLSALRAFEAAARHASFKLAAGELSLTPTAISHQVRALESQLGLKLFTRAVRSVRLTPEGEQLFPVLREGFDRFAEAVGRLQAQRRAAVTVSTTPAFAARWLLPHLPAFQSRHPGIDLRLHASNAVVDLEAGAADLAVRYGHGSYPGLDAWPLAEDSFAPVASPRLKLRDPRELARHTLIHFEWQRPDASHPSWKLWARAARLRLDTTSGLHFTDESHAIAAAVAGQGVALLSLVLVRQELAQGLLRLPFGTGGTVLPGMRYTLLRATAGSPAAQAAHAWIAGLPLASG
ncbi:MAG: LysR family transcriptional regulator [Aquabacterium sp.]|jgi:LysR family glycine cleavage system transcriptional activator|nr:MAG: LysR family transcriptional regulator [Aquabacterium sp.]